jgi:hypothetical protein
MVMLHDIAANGREGEDAELQVDAIEPLLDRVNEVGDSFQLLDWRAGDDETEFAKLPPRQQKPWDCTAEVNEAAVALVLTPTGTTPEWQGVAVTVEIDRGCVRVYAGPEGADGFFSSTVTAERCAIEPTGAPPLVIEHGQPTIRTRSENVEQIMGQGKSE